MLYSEVVGLSADGTTSAKTSCLSNRRPHRDVAEHSTTKMPRSPGWFHESLAPRWWW